MRVKAKQGRALLCDSLGDYEVTVPLSSFYVDTVREYRRIRNLVDVDCDWHWVRKDEIHVLGPEGIGDLHWLFLKLEDLKRGSGAKRLVLHRYTPAANHRSDHFILMNPTVDEFLSDGLNIRDIVPYCGYLIDSFGYDYVIDPSVALEAKLELNIDFMPEVKINYNYTMRWPEPAKLSKRTPVLYIGDTYQEYMWHGKWVDADWATVAMALEQKFGVPPLVLGSTKDKTKVLCVERWLSSPYSLNSLVGQTSLEVALSYIRQAPLVVGTICGLTILSAALGVKTIALWPDQNSFTSLPETMWRSWLPSNTELTYCPRGFSTSVENIVSLMGKGMDEILRIG